MHKDKFMRILDPQKRPFLLALLPIFFLAGLLLTKTVNVPYWDQWEFVPLIQHVNSGHIYFNDFWQQHNEHRLFFPRIIMIISAVLTGWNVRVENLIGFVIACASFVILLKTVKSTQQELKQKILFITPLLLSLIWFSPVQAENWLWGWQIQWFLNVFAVMVIVREVALIRDRLLPLPKLLIIIGAGILAQYSLGNGALIWPLVVAALLFLKTPLIKTAMVGIVGLISTGLYYHHYSTPAIIPIPSKTLFLHEPVAFVKYVLIYLGRSLSFAHRLTPLLGLMLLTVFISLAIYLYIKKRSIFKAVLPWIVLGLYAIGSAMITAISRLGLGLEQAYNSSRYITISSLLLVSTIIMVIESREIFSKLSDKYFRPITYTIISGLFVLVLSNAVSGVVATNKRSQDLRNEKYCTHLANPSDACLLEAYPYKVVLQERLDYVKKIHWAGY